MIDGPPLKLRPPKVPKQKETDLARNIIHRLIGERLAVLVDPWRARYPPMPHGKRPNAAMERQLHEDRARLIRLALRVAKDTHDRHGRPILVLWRQNTGARMLPGKGKDDLQLVKWGSPGSGDWAGLIYPSGRRCEFEIKRPGEHPNPEQHAHGELVNASGGVWQCWHSVEEAVQGARKLLDPVSP